MAKCVRGSLKGLPRTQPEGIASARCKPLRVVAFFRVGGGRRRASFGLVTGDPLVRLLLARGWQARPATIKLC